MERAIDAALRMDPETRNRLQTIDGKSLQINVTDLEMSLVISVLDGDVSIANAHSSSVDNGKAGKSQTQSSAVDKGEPENSGSENSESDTGGSDENESEPFRADATISGKVNTLRTLLSGNEAIYSGDVKIEGDIGMTQHLRQILSNIELDWQEALSPIAGDAITHRIDVAQAQLMEWFKRTRGAAKMNLREYLQEEAELLAPSSELETFCEEVDELRAAADRVAAKVQRLEKKLEKPC